MIIYDELQKKQEVSEPRRFFVFSTFQTFYGLKFKHVSFLAIQNDDSEMLDFFVS